MASDRNFLAPVTSAMLHANYADLLVYLNEKQLALEAINTAIEIDKSRQTYQILQSQILASIDQ